MKPTACRLWPFKVSRRPTHGKVDESYFVYKGEGFHVYADSICQGIRWGKPSKLFMERTVPEFVEISLGMRDKQVYSTSTVIPPIISLETKHIQRFFL
jgi:hypothetical protein